MCWYRDHATREAQAKDNNITKEVQPRDYAAIVAQPRNYAAIYLPSPKTMLPGRAQLGDHEARDPQVKDEATEQPQPRDDNATRRGRPAETQQIMKG